ncbi:hypothetical protein KY312_03180 [Candidatus Woesearchaeota archaeon]|nr:hypothetical protein [Candidatus Woesearchaeota archaeon]
MEYFLGRYVRRANVKNQISLADIAQVIRERNKPKYADRLFMMLDHFQGSKYSTPYIKCFDRKAFESKVVGVIDASELHRQKIDKSGRLLIPQELAVPARIESVDRIVVVEAEKADGWGMTFGIYNLDYYHEKQAGKMETQYLKALEKVIKSET